MIELLVGFTSNDYRFLSVSRVLRLYRWIGIPFSETTVNIFNKPKQSLRNSRKMGLGLHLPNIGNCGYDFSNREHSIQIQKILRQIQEGREVFSFRYAVFHPPEGDGTPEFQFYLKNLKEVGIPLVLENIRGFDVRRFSSLYRLLKSKLGDLLSGICLDIPHAYLSGADWRSFFRTFEKEVQVVHLSDCGNDMDLHKPFGMGGDLNLKSIVAWLHSSRYQGVLNFEIMPPSLDDLDGMFENFRQTCQILGKPTVQMMNRMKMIARTGKYLSLFNKLPIQ